MDLWETEIFSSGADFRQMVTKKYCPFSLISAQGAELTRGGA